jgi:GH25 family lysozyme M1 (1,4-beta-N-acetylmuramidase)
MSNIKGIDISNNNGSIDFGKVAADGVEYVYVKATEGQSFKDSTMEGFYNECKSNGLKVGAYHFLVGTSSPEAQAANFYEKIKDFEWNLVPMMDIETNFDGLSDYVVRFAAKFKELCSWQLGVYSYTSFLNYISDAAETIKDFPFWEANYNNDPWKLPSNFFTNRIGHQYTEKGYISGVSEACDVDVFTDGICLTDGTIPGEWILQDNKYWYKHSDGTYTKDGWEQIKGKWYAFDEEGYMITGWKKYNNNWFYLGDAKDGSMKIGWFKIEQDWYYFNPNSDGTQGAKQTGWIKDNDKWYYLSYTGAMQTGWINVDNKDYLLDSQGVMYANCEENGYRFGSDGVATKLS